MGQAFIEDLIPKGDDPVEYTPEQRLLAAILCTALKDFLCPEACLAREYRRTARYYFETPRSDEYGSLGHVCRELGLCHKRLRELALKQDTVELMRSMGMIGWARKI